MRGFDWLFTRRHSHSGLDDQTSCLSCRILPVTGRRVGHHARAYTAAQYGTTVSDDAPIKEAQRALIGRSRSLLPSLASFLRGRAGMHFYQRRLSCATPAIWSGLMT